jgi:hypothetical protein
MTQKATKYRYLKEGEIVVDGDEVRVVGSYYTEVGNSIGTKVTKEEEIRQHFRREVK